MSAFDFFAQKDHDFNMNAENLTEGFIMQIPHSANTHSPFSGSSLANPLLALTIDALRQGFVQKDFSVPEVTQAYIHAMDQQKNLNLYITATPDEALAQAQVSQQRYNEGTPRALEGIPMAFKDAFCTKDVLTTAASKILYNFRPPYESTLTHRLKEAGVVMLGKANMDEFCMGSSTTPVATGASLNPWNPRHSVGGSSGGSAGAVAAGCALAALGTDTGGSIRQPAAFCGVVGVKPTYGRCSRWGVVAFVSSLDSPGPLTRSVADSAKILEVIAGPDVKDMTCSPRPVPAYSQWVNKSVKGLRIGIPEDLWRTYSVDPDILSAMEKAKDFFRGEGCELVKISLPSAMYALHAYYVMSSAQAASNLMRYDGIKYGLRWDSGQDLRQDVQGGSREHMPSATRKGVAMDLDTLYRKTRGQGFGLEVKRRILLGTYILSRGYHAQHYQKAQGVVQSIQQDFQAAFGKADVLLMPTTPTPAFSLDSINNKDPVKMYINDVLTVPVNMAGVCGISVPVGLSSQGLPMGLQIVAPAFCEERLFQAGSALEKMTPPRLAFQGNLR